MFLAQAIGTVIGCVVNYVAVTQVIDTKRMYLDGTMVDPTAQVWIAHILWSSQY